MCQFQMLHHSDNQQRSQSHAQPVMLQALPTDDNCEEEGKVVCNGGRIKGQPGVAMDDLVYVCTKIARQMDAAGIDKVLKCYCLKGLSAGMDWGLCRQGFTQPALIMH